MPRSAGWGSCRHAPCSSSTTRSSGRFRWLIYRNHPIGALKITIWYDQTIFVMLWIKSYLFWVLLGGCVSIEKIYFDNFFYLLRNYMFVCEINCKRFLKEINGGLNLYRIRLAKNHRIRILIAVSTDSPPLPAKSFRVYNPKWFEGILTRFCCNFPLLILFPAL